MKQTLKLTLMMVLGVFLTFCSSKSNTPESDMPESDDWGSICTTDCIDVGGGHQVSKNSDFARVINGREKVQHTLSYGLFTLREKSTPIVIHLDAKQEEWEKGTAVNFPLQENITEINQETIFTADLSTDADKTNIYHQFFNQNGKAITPQKAFITINNNLSTTLSLIKDNKPDFLFPSVKLDDMTKILSLIIYEDADGKKLYNLGPVIIITRKS